MKDAVLAAEDARFYEHGGVDYKGLLRAGMANMNRVKSQGASTITMQVARNVYLSSEKTLTRKIYEVLLTFKLEHLLSKDQIFEIYLNQIYLGNRAYGFAAASEAYFGKPLTDITIAQAAMLRGPAEGAGRQQSCEQPARARGRQLYVIDRMRDAGFITAEQAADAKKEELHLRDGADPTRLHAEYVAETVRQLMYSQYGDSTYTRGLKVYTSLVAADQAAPLPGVAQGDHGLRASADLPRTRRSSSTCRMTRRSSDEAVDDALADHPDNGDVMSAVVLKANAKEITAVRANGDVLQITGDGLKPAQSGLSDKAPPNIKDPPRRRDPRRPHARRAPGKSPSCPRSRAHSSPSTRATAPSRRWSAASTSTRTSSTMSRRPGVSRVRASSPSSTRPRSRKASRPRR